MLLLLVLVWSICSGIGLAQITQAQPSTGIPENSSTAQAATEKIGTVDRVPPRYKLGEELYLENCATCHIGISPAILPSETWRQLLQDSEHYGATLQPLTGPRLFATWDYLRTFSRPHAADEEVPYRIYQSRYFKALHPRVKFESRVKLTSCVSCHPGADKYDFRSLSAEWQNAP